MFSIKVLEDQEFDKLPYKHAKEALGCADPATKTAYVRNTHWGDISKTVNLLTIQHELDELVAKTSPHEEDGIRYKKGRDIFAPIGTALLSLIPGVGIPLSMAASAGYGAYKVHKGESTWPQVAMGTALTGLGAKIGQSLPGYQAGVTASKAAGGGWIGQSLSGAQSLLTGSSGAQRLLNAGYTTNAGNIARQMGPYGLGTSTGAGSLGAGTLLAGSTNIINRSNIATSGASNIMDLLKNPMTQLGLGAMGISGLTTSAKPPQIGPIISKWLTQDTVTRAGAAAQKIADVEYAGEWSPDKETTAFINVMETDIRKAYKQRAIDMDKTSMAVNEGWMRSGERLEMLRRLSEEEQREVDNMKSEWLYNNKQQFAQRQYGYVMQELQADDATKRDLLYGELSDVMWKYQISEQDLMNFRKLAADAGMYMLGQGMGLSAAQTNIKPEYKSLLSGMVQ